MSSECPMLNKVTLLDRWMAPAKTRGEMKGWLVDKLTYE